MEEIGLTYSANDSPTLNACPAFTARRTRLLPLQCRHPTQFALPIPSQLSQTFLYLSPTHLLLVDNKAEKSYIMDGGQLRDEAMRDRVRAAEEFLDPADQRAKSYRADVLLMLNRGLRRLIVSLDEIRSHSREMADG